MKKYNQYQIIIHIFIIWLVFYAFLKYLVFKGTPSFLIGGIKDLFVISIFILVLTNIISKKYIKLKEFKFYKRIFLLIGPLIIVVFFFFLLDIFNNKSIYDALYALRDLLFPFIILLIGLMIGIKKGFNIVAFIRLITILSILILLYGIYQFFFFTQDTILSMGYTPEEKIYNFIRTNPETHQVLGIRVLGIFSSALEMGFACILMFYSSYIGYKIDKGRIMHKIYIICMLLSIINIFLTFTRVAIITFGFTLLLAAYKINKRYLIGIILLVIPSFFYIIYKLTYASGGVDLSTANHILGYIKTWELLQQNPWGYGISFTGLRTDEQFGIDGTYLNIVLSIGLIGLISYIYIYMNLIKILKNINLSDDIAHTAFLPIIAWLITCLIATNQSSIIAWLFHLWLGIIIGFLYYKYFLNIQQHIK